MSSRVAGGTDTGFKFQLANAGSCGHPELLRRCLCMDHCPWVMVFLQQGAFVLAMARSSSEVPAGDQINPLAFILSILLCKSLSYPAITPFSFFSVEVCAGFYTAMLAIASEHLLVAH